MCGHINYTNKELEDGIVEYRTSTMPKDENGKVLDLKFYELMVKLLQMRSCIIFDTQRLESLLASPIQKFLNPDKERWYHYFDYINGFKRESEYKRWYSHKRQKEFTAMRSKWKNAIAVLREEYNDLEKMATMSADEHFEYCKNRCASLLK